jgi:Tfp pilus assembly protein PilV
MSIFNFSVMRMQSQWPRLLRKKGFFLIEACISMLLVLLLSSSLALWYTHLSKEQAYFRNRVKALGILCTAVEKMRAQGTILLDETKEYKIHWHILPDRELKSYKKVTLSVVWPNGDKVAIDTGAIFQ